MACSGNGGGGGGGYCGAGGGGGFCSVASGLGLLGCCGRATAAGTATEVGLAWAA